MQLRLLDQFQSQTTYSDTAANTDFAGAQLTQLQIICLL